MMTSLYRRLLYDFEGMKKVPDDEVVESFFLVNMRKCPLMSEHLKDYDREEEGGG